MAAVLEFDDRAFRAKSVPESKRLRLAVKQLHLSGLVSDVMWNPLESASVSDCA